ncbi:transcriptional regulator [Cryobacterium roopkundense]|uniref:Manganese transport regulator n=1 Tax=Cryobacterium roopkundense TaxID=1001240 RepID=A0A099J9U5_9MICO|nr:metal-dependent transcriptional regulator [Cryobacterium roopkundense]KGJ75164.1 transcriptional regulator [Cryobacterium roopkundense]MBB5642968.1 DtxR family Mn-dependent transcriptional regulator [Cryobacterium roopkundense]
MKHTIRASEDYLKTIYSHTEWQNEPITPKALATRLGVSPSSVTEMVKKLALAGLITHVPYGPLSLTDAGVLRATAVVRRHRLIETWLVREMGYDWDQVHEEAEVLEHSISDRLLEAINMRLGHPACDPHGDPIPFADGTSPHPDAILLARVGIGHVGTVLRVSDRDSAVLRELAADGIGPGVEFTLLEPLTLQLTDGQTRRVTAGAGDAVWVTHNRIAAVPS